jgi:hypothetical protein
MNARTLTIAALVALLALAGCGSGSKSAKSGSSQSEAASAATGDIPDNQVFLVFRGRGYSLKYPEGWTRKGTAADLTFRDKGNSIHLVVRRGRSPTAGTVGAGARTVSLKGQSAIKLVYRQPGLPDPVTGKRPQLVVDRYVYAKGGRVATLDLATPKGVDNVDAYRLISQSFRWR